jgi:hypothetical protein
MAFDLLCLARTVYKTDGEDDPGVAAQQRRCSPISQGEAAVFRPLFWSPAVMALWLVIQASMQVILHCFLDSSLLFVEVHDIFCRTYHALTIWIDM